MSTLDLHDAPILTYNNTPFSFEMNEYRREIGGSGGKFNSRLANV